LEIFRHSNTNPNQLCAVVDYAVGSSLLNRVTVDDALDEIVAVFRILIPGAERADVPEKLLS